MSVDIESIAKLDWEKKWAVPFTFLKCSYVAEQYYPYLLKHWGITYHHALIVVAGDRARCYLSQAETESIGRFLDEKISTDFSLLDNWGNELREQMQKLQHALAQPVADVVSTTSVLSTFEDVIGTFMPFYLQVNRVGNYLSAQADARIMPLLDKLRLFSEPAYGDMDAFFRKICVHIAHREKFDADLLRWIMSEELRTYVKERRLPSTEVLMERRPLSGLYMDNGMVQVLDAEAVKFLEDAVAQKYISSDEELRGQTASAGFATGVVRVITDPAQPGIFEDGDILVSEATRPEYVPLMKKAAAIITDSGGMLSHAAVVSREMKKPCIVGLQIATKVFKDGDMVEVNATNGIVRKI